MNKRLWVSVFASLCLCGSLHAQSVWTGNGSNAYWSTAANWQGGTAPVPGSLTSLSFGGSATNAANDFLTGSAFSNLTFAAGASPFSLTGNGFALYGNLTNGATSRQRIASDVTWCGKNATLDTGSGGIALDGYFSGSGANAYFVKNGSGTLTLNGGASFTSADYTYINALNGGTLVIASDAVFTRLDLQNNARLIVTNNATLSGFTGNYVFWQGCTVDLYSGKINVQSSLLSAQDWSKTCAVNVRGGTFVGGGGLRWANNGNVLLTVSGSGEFQWLAGNALSENGGSWITMNGGTFRRGSNGDNDFDICNGIVSTKSVGTITNRIAFNGGAFLTGSFVFSNTKSNLHTTLFFNGGTLRAGKTTTSFFGTHPELIDSQVGPTGLVFDTQSYAVTVNDALESGVASDGGLTKLGSGTLILATNCTYTGATTVSNGTLRLDAPVASTALRLAPYAAAVVASNAVFSGALVVETGATFAFSTNATTVQSLTSASFGTSQGAGAIAFEITDAATLDQLSVTAPGGLDLSRTSGVLLYQTGTTARFSANGSYPLFLYTGSPIGSVSHLRVANPDPAKTYAFSANAGVITLTISDGTASQWVSPADGTWFAATNWSGGVPNATGATAQFLTNATAALAVTLDAPATVGGLVFSNSAAYTLAGNNALTLDAGTQQPSAVVQAGQHTVAVPLALAADALVQPASGATLVLAGPISGTGPLIVTGAGTVTLTATNQTSTTVSDGRLAIADGASLAGGLAIDNGTLVVTQTTALATAVAIGTRGATLQSATNTTLTLAAAPAGSGVLTKTGPGTLVLTTPLGNAGGAAVGAGTLDFTNDVFGTKPLLLSGGTARYTGASALSLGAPLTVGAASTLRTEQGPVTLNGPLAFSAGVLLGIESTNGVTLAGSASIVDTGRKLQLREGTLRLTSGADYTLSSGARDTVELGRDANKPTMLVIESGAHLRTGGIHLNTTDAAATNCDSVVRQEGGAVEVTFGEGLFIRNNGASAGTYLMNGGTFSAPAASWTSLGAKGPAYLTVNGGTMTLGRLALGVTNSSSTAYNGTGSVLTVTGGRLVVANFCSWMSDTYLGRYNSAVLGNGTAGSGELDMVATTRSVPYASGGGRAAFTFNGGLLKATGLAPFGSSSLTNYLYGVDTLTLRAGGARIETPVADLAFVQPLRAAETNGGVVKTGLAALTLASTNNVWFGTTDVRAGTLRARLNQNLQHLYPDGLLALWTFDDGTPADQSGNGFDLSQQNTTNVVVFTDGGYCGKAARFSGGSSLKMSYAQAFNLSTYTVSAWVKLAQKPGSHQGIFSTRVDSGENNASGTFDFKFNSGNYISNFNPNNLGNGAHITAALGGNLDSNVWYMITYVIAPNRTDAYLNGVWKASTNAMTSALLTSGHLLTIGRGVATSTNPNAEIMAAGGMIDDVAVFARALSANEVAAMYAAAVPTPPVSVAENAALDLLGSTNTTPSVAGGGVISNGTLTVTGTVAPVANSGAAVLTIDNLTLDGTNLVYACTADDATNALVRVTGTLSTTNIGTLALGHAATPVQTPFRRTVMTYGTLADGSAAALAKWRIRDDGVSSAAHHAVIVDTANKHIDVEIRYLGTMVLVY